MISAIARGTGILLALALVVILGSGVWIGYQAFYSKELALERSHVELEQQRAQINQLEETVAAKQRRIDRLETAVRLLKVERRVAYIDVLDQHRKPDSDRLETTLKFVEVNDAGEPLGEAKTFSIDGDLLYVDYWVIKFVDDAVEKQDPLRSTSIALFRRLFGEYQEPSQGFTIDEPGTRPQAYGGTVMSAFQRELWDNFWEYATDAEKAKEAGVRAAHGEAPSTKLLPNKRYKLMLRASGGFSIVPEDRLTPATDNSA